jgi:hypothetical protein
MKLCDNTLCDRLDLPLPRPRTHCGYAQSIGKRARQHADHVSSTWRGLLVEAAFAVVFPDHRYTFHLFAVGFLAQPDEVALAERAWTRITNSDYKHGGFCVAAPRQCASALQNQINGPHRERTWDDLQAYREEYTLFSMNATAEKKRLSPGNYRGLADFRLAVNDVNANIATIEDDRWEQQKSLGDLWEDTERDILPTMADLSVSVDRFVELREAMDALLLR